MELTILTLFSGFEGAGACEDLQRLDGSSARSPGDIGGQAVVFELCNTNSKARREYITMTVRSCTAGQVPINPCVTAIYHSRRLTRHPWAAIRSTEARRAQEADRRRNCVSLLSMSDRQT
jgi:hypothetical protein